MVGDCEPLKMLLGAGDSVLISRVACCLLRFEGFSCSASSSRDLLAPAEEAPFVSVVAETIGVSSAVSLAYFNLSPIFFQAGTCCDMSAVGLVYSGMSTLIPQQYVSNLN